MTYLLHLKRDQGLLSCLHMSVWACSVWGLYLQEQDVRQIFDPFGPIDYVTMQKELAGGRQSSVAFVQYASLQLIA